MPAAYRSILRSGWHGAIALFTSHNRPGDPCHLVGDSDSDQMGWLSLQQLICPDADGRLLVPRVCRTTAVAPPPDECSFGTSPSQAANCRPERNTFASLMVAASAVAVMKPDAGDRLKSLAGRVRSMPSHAWLCKRGADAMCDLQI